MQRNVCSEAYSRLAGQEIPCFYGKRMFITVSQKLTTEPSHPISLRSVSLTYLYPRSSFFLSHSSTEIVYACPVRATCLAAFIRWRSFSLRKFLPLVPLS